MIKYAPSKIALFIFIIIQSTLNVFAGNSVLSTGNWYKLSAYETGIYVITYNDLLNMGFPVSSIDPRNISIYGNGPGELPLLNNVSRPDDLLEMAIEVKGESDGIFNSGDTIFFYNHSQITWDLIPGSNQFQHSINHYSDSTSFFLTVASVPGKRIADLQSLSSFTDSTSTFTDYAVHELDSINFLHSGKEWYGEQFDMVSNQSRSFPLWMNNLSNGDTIYFNTKFAGRSIAFLGTSSVIYTLNSTNFVQTIPGVGTNLQDNYVSLVNYNFSAVAPVNTDSVTISLQSTDVSALGWLNYIEINAIRQLQFNTSPFCFRDSRHFDIGTVVKFNLTTNSSLKIWDVSEFSSVKNQLFTSGTSQISFNAAADSLHEYIAFDGNNYFHPTFQSTISNQNLHSISQQNMIIVTDADFVNEAITLALHHQSHDNLSTAVVTTKQIYNEYSSGQQDPVAIRDFIRQVYFSASSSDSLKYVLLFGSPSYDFKDKLGYGKGSIPIYESDGSINLTQTFCTDDFYSLMDSSEGNLASSNIPDVAVGRIPVKNQSEALIINKIIAYNSSSSMNQWRTKIVAVADDQDYNIHFKQIDTLMNRIENYDCRLIQDKIYIDAYIQIHDSITNSDSYPEARLAIENSIKEGCAVIQYTGRGGTLGWAHERILDYAFLDTVSNINNLPLFIANTASFNSVDDPAIVSCGRATMMNPNGGGIGSVSAARLAYSSSNFNFSIYLNQKLFGYSSVSRPTIGEAFLYTKQAMHSDQFTYSISLLGDPAVRLLIPENDVVTTSFSSDTIISWQPIQLTGEIHDNTGAFLSTFNGTVEVTLFKPKTRHLTLGNDSSNAGDPGIPAPFYLWDDTLYNTNVPVVNGSFSLSFITPPGIDSGFGIGRIAYYAQDGVQDAMGCYQQIVYKNLTPGIPEYSELQIQIFPNPSTDVVYCSLGGKVPKDCTYSLTGIDGIELRREKIVLAEFLINRNSLTAGVYFLKIQDGKKQTVKVAKLVFE